MLVVEHSDLDLTVIHIQLSYPAAINDPGYAQNNLTLQRLRSDSYVLCF